MNNNEIQIIEPEYKSKILLCESDDLIRRVLSNQVKLALNAEIFEADNGKMASKILSLRKFDLIITSMLLPVKSGLQIVEYVRQELQMDTPILIMTTDDQERTITKVYDMGVNDFVHKPFNPIELNLRAKYLISHTSQNLKRKAS